MKKLYTLLTCIIALSASAQTFDEVLSRIVNSNPDIAALAQNNNATIESLASENNLADPEISARHLWGHDGNNKMGFGISQSFDWPGLYSARSKSINATKAALSELYNASVLDKTLEVKLLMIDFIAAKCNYSYFTCVKENMDSLQTKYSEAYSKGEVSVLDLNKIKIERIKVAKQANECKLRCENIRAEIASLTTDKDAVAMLDNINDYPADAILSESEYENLINQSDPNIAYYEAMTTVADRNISVAKMQGLPGFSLGYEFEREEGTNFNGISFSMSLPFFSGRHKKSSAISEKAAYETTLISEKIKALSQMRALRSEAKTLYEEVNDYASIISDNSHLYLLKKALEGGEINLFTYIQELNYFIEAKSDYQDLVYQYNQSLTKLNRLKLVK